MWVKWNSKNSWSEIYFLGSHSLFHKHSLFSSLNRSWVLSPGLRASLHWLPCYITALCFLGRPFHGVAKNQTHFWCFTRIQSRNNYLCPWQKLRNLKKRVWSLVDQQWPDWTLCVLGVMQVCALRQETVFTWGNWPQGQAEWAASSLWNVLQPCKYTLRRKPTCIKVPVMQII